MAATRGAAFTATVGMIDRVHCHAAVVRHAAHPALAAGFADRDVHVVRVRHRANRRHALTVDQALLGRGEAQDHVVLVTPDNLSVSTGRARKLSALADLELDIVHDGSDRHAADGHGVAWFYVDVLA